MTAADLPGFSIHSNRIQALKCYIHAHMDEQLNRKVLAALTGLSVPQLHRIFTAHVGENITAYIRRERMLRAGRKLRMGAVDITQVALAAGYNTHAAFSKVFKRQFGLSPSEFRRLNCVEATYLLMKGKSP
jgi:AraC-like DNA-binding protein